MHLSRVLHEICQTYFGLNVTTLSLYFIIIPLHAGSQPNKREYPTMTLPIIINNNNIILSTRSSKCYVELQLPGTL